MLCNICTHYWSQHTFAIRASVGIFERYFPKLVRNPLSASRASILTSDVIAAATEIEVGGERTQRRRNFAVGRHPDSERILSATSRSTCKGDLSSTGWSSTEAALLEAAASEDPEEADKSFSCQGPPTVSLLCLHLTEDVNIFLMQKWLSLQA